MRFKLLFYFCHKGILLTDCNVNANRILTLLIYDGINCNSSFTRLSVTDNKLSLTLADGNKSVNM